MSHPVLDPLLHVPENVQHTRHPDGGPEAYSLQHNGRIQHLQTANDIRHDYDLAVERAQSWTGISRFGFNAMLASPDYKNKLRLKPDKKERIIYFLTHPDAKSQERNRADAQTKHQSQQWALQDSILYRKADQSHQLRRHVDADEVFDILTAEHLRSGHNGRDKMLKLLEGRYIGYTKEELMFVLEHCLVCSGKYIRGAAAKRREQMQLEGRLEGGGVVGA